MYFREMCRATDADYISLTMPQAKSTEELLLRYDNQADRPYPVPLQRDTGTYMCSIAHRFINVSITGQGGDGKLYCVDNYKSVPRKWLDALPDSIEPRCEQALQGQCRLKTHNDFDKQRFEDEWWKNMLLIPVVTQQGTYVLTVAGKKGTQCFSILDEELLVLSGQQFCHMVAQYDLMDHLEGILDIMSVDASAIDLGFLSEKVVQLTKAARGAIFVIDECTVPGAPYEHELYFVIDTPVGKKEIRMPLTGKSMAGAAILDNELINIPDCYQDDRFDPTMDKKTGFHTTQMLCVPVAASTGEVIGAIQVINTQNNMSFTDGDVELLRVFRVYVQIAIMNKKGMSF